MTKINGQPLIKKLPLLFTVCFLLLAGLHYFSQRPLWLDENFVLKVIRNYRYADFQKQFTDSQSYPRLYLAGIKFLSTRFEFHVLALRFFPFLCMLAAFGLWRRHYRAFFADPSLWALSLFSFAASYYFVYYAAELKPYSMDMLVIAVFLLFLTKQGQFLPRKELVFAALLPFLIFFSYGSIFIFWMVPFNYALLLRGSRKFLKPLVVSAIFSFICFLCFFYFDIRLSTTRGNVTYWESYFICTQDWSCFGETFGEGIKRLGIVWWSKEKILQKGALIFLPFFLYGAGRYGWTALRSHKGTLMHPAAVGFVLLAELVVLGFLHKYPFTGGRVTLFLAPFVMYFIVLGLADLRRVKYAGAFLWGYAYLYFAVCLLRNAYLFAKMY